MKVLNFFFRVGEWRSNKSSWTIEFAQWRPLVQIYQLLRFSFKIRVIGRRFLNSRYGNDLFLSCVFGEQAILSSRKEIVSWPFDSASLYWFYSIIVLSRNSFIYVIADKRESLKEYINVVPNFSYKKTEIHPVSLALFFRVWSAHLWPSLMLICEFSIFFLQIW